MIVCPNCQHENPDGATSCEACYTALPATKACPACGASVQLDATFCGQCGHNLVPAATPPLVAPSVLPVVKSVPLSAANLPPTVLTNQELDFPASSSPLVVNELPVVTPAPVSSEPVAAPPMPVPSNPEPVASQRPVLGELPSAVYQLLHVQTNQVVEIPPQLQVIHIGKPNDRTPPDIDVSGFPCAEVVSRVQASIRVEGDNYYLEDSGSANGTYINHNVLVKGNQHRLRNGDRIGLGKGDIVTFIFQSHG